MMNTERTNITNWIRSMSLIASTGKRCGLSESTANIFAQHVNEATALADGWDWNEEYFNFALENFNIEQLMRAGSEYSDFVWSDGTMAVIWPN